MRGKSPSRLVLKLFSSGISRLPRIKGLGVPIAWLANRYKDEDIVIEKVVWGSRMRFKTNDLIGRLMIFSHNYYDREERKLISQMVRNGDIVVDVGANIGIYTLFLSRLVGEHGKVVAIEAEQNNVTDLRRNLALNDTRNVEVHHCGVSDRAEVLPLLLNTTGNAGGHSFFDQSHIIEPETQMVNCVPLAAIIGNRRPRFMKLDIEGFEHRVLSRYFKDTDSAFWPEHIMLEDNPARREEDAVELCVSLGYAIHKAVDYNVFLTLKVTAAGGHS